MTIALAIVFNQTFHFEFGSSNKLLKVCQINWLNNLSYFFSNVNQKSSSEQTDPVLWQQIREGEESALEILYKRHYQVLLRYAVKLAKEKEIAQDCLQEMFFQLWTRRDKLKEVTSVRFYLMKWLKREVVRSLNDKHKGVNILPIDGDTESLELVIEDFFEKKEAKNHTAVQVRKALELLTPRDREVIYMRFFLEMTYEEICNALELSYQVVMNYMHRALKSLRANHLINKIIGVFPFFIGGWWLFFNWLG